MKNQTTLRQRYLVVASLCLFCASGWAVPKAAETEDDPVGFSEAVAPPRTAGKARTLPPPAAAGASAGVKTVGKTARQGGKRVTTAGSRPGHAAVRPSQRLALSGQPGAAAGKPASALAGRKARAVVAPEARPTQRGAPKPTRFRKP
ncbi:MAG: hypothetical protein RKP46_02950 [Candidatus Accumulibacter sp.]|uniref:hypothetical protein n=1 Tax=Accumulibacter sp. TaxID=2053492 RepID=UPI00287AF802|nr:hypothetical protein [Accumulibacter sp.]MDS4013297.1 hypothetical protein [Accumulibacter sp.]